jgi:hypothetical protein
LPHFLTKLNRMLKSGMWPHNSISGLATASHDAGSLLPQGSTRASDHGAWWGQFRFGWAVSRAGKWADPDYAGLSYPAFAGGGGYALSARPVRLLAALARDLYRYQGEDVSLGVWLAALGVEMLHDPDWHVLLPPTGRFAERTACPLSVPELGADALRALDVAPVCS